MKISVNSIIASTILVAKVSAECWSEKLFGYPCCEDSNTKEVQHVNRFGRWGVENGDWCGIREFQPDFEVHPLCPSPTIDKEECSKKGGKVRSVLFGVCPSPTCVTKEPNTAFSDCPAYRYMSDRCYSKGGAVVHVTETGCAKPTCIFSEKVCWAKKLGYSCCEDDNTEVVYTDENGSWGLAYDGSWCGIIPARGENCPYYKYDAIGCSRSGGEVLTTTQNGCPKPTCVIPDSPCKAESISERCCLGEASEVAFISKEYPHFWDSYNQYCVKDELIPETHKLVPTNSFN